MDKVKSNQGARQRNATRGFIDAMRKLQGVMSTSTASDQVSNGPFEFEFEQGVFYSLKHDGDLIARLDCRRSKQYGSVAQINTAIAHLMPSESEEIQAKALTMIKNSTTLLNNALTMIKEQFPDAGLSYCSHSLHILRDVNQAETPENTLYIIPLASTVRSII